MATCPHGKEVCADCAKLLTVPEAVQYRADHPGTTQAEAAELAGASVSAIKNAEQRAVTKRPMGPNVTGYDPTKRPYYDVDWPTVVPTEAEMEAWVNTWLSWRPDHRLTGQAIINNHGISRA